VRWFLVITAFIFLTCEFVSAQVSQGGQPLEVPALRTRGVPQKTMPFVNNKHLQQQADDRQDQEIRRKSLKFAHGFEVNFSPETDGLWISNIRGFDVWQMKIRSEGAYSIHLVFDKFHLSAGSRLFIFSESTGHFIGAFTSANNKISGKFATAPIAGDELTIQYEVPAGQNGRTDFVISVVNHDFIGILKSERRPMGISAGWCNIDVNCVEGDQWMDEKDAVCRIITTKRTATESYSEICTGVLLNNTAEDQVPYIITAAHCIEEARFAETSVFTFNYESPYCAPLDGDPGNSVSGAVLRAISDSLDFALVELSLIPPPEYRPFFAGWEHRRVLPDSTNCIHQPQGDIKKIAYDSDPPLYATLVVTKNQQTRKYTSNGFLRVVRWDAGVTENGSSGAPLFNQNKSLVGTLSGGAATCHNPVNDYFARFDMAWEFRPQPTEQLKYWLDPINKNSTYLPGKRFYTGENFCSAFTNLEDFDEHRNVALPGGIQAEGYWGGTNKLGITEFAERFFLSGEEQLYGVSIGIGLVRLSNSTSNSEISVNVYNGGMLPETVIHSEKVKIRTLASNAMNYIGFSKIVVPSDTFYVAFELSNLQPQETFVAYQSLRVPERKNFFLFRQNGWWHDFKTSDLNTGNSSMANVLELVACNVKAVERDTVLVRAPMEALIYPNPANAVFTFEAGQQIIPENIRVFNLIGQEIQVKMGNYKGNKIQIDLSGNIPGIYIVRFQSEKGMLSKKVSFIPW
jgi:lysyl endopeptidase